MRGRPADFWGKLSSDRDGWHPLVDHSADVAACCEVPQKMRKRRPSLSASDTKSSVGVENGAAEGEGGDLASCDYWRYCGFDGYLCSCCGGGLTACPPGTVASPTSWVGTCQHPTDGKEYIIAYRDCCGKDVCNRCFCDNNKGQVPIYRPQLDNDIIWCFGAKNFAYHCTTAIRLGAKS